MVLLALDKDGLTKIASVQTNASIMPLVFNSTEFSLLSYFNGVKSLW